MAKIRNTVERDNYTTFKTGQNKREKVFLTFPRSTYIYHQEPQPYSKIKQTADIPHKSVNNWTFFCDPVVFGYFIWWECSLNSVHRGSYIYSELTPIYLMYVHGCTIYCEMNNCLLNCLHNHSPGKHINDYFGLVLFVVVGCHRYLWKMVTVVWWNISIVNLMFICFTTQKITDKILRAHE